MNAVPSHWQLHNAARWIRKGGTVAYPTEAVFGLGCDPANPLAVEKLLALKSRAWQKGLILLATDLQQLEPWLQTLSDNQLQQLEKSWPGPATWLLPASSCCPDWLTGTHETLAVRISAHPVVRRLCDILDGPVTSTSANISGRRPARSVLDVRLQFGTQVDFVLPGMPGNRKKPSRIRDLASGKLIRD